MATPAEKLKSEPRSIKELTGLIEDKVKNWEDGTVWKVREIGELAAELKPQIAGGAKGWDRHCREHFGRTGHRVDRYIAIYRKELRAERQYASQSEAGYKPNANYSKVWGAIKDDIPHYDRMKAEEHKQVAAMDTRALQKKLGHQIIDIGFKALAVQMHPDKGGTGDGRMMAALMEVRDRLRRCLDKPTSSAL